MKSSVIQKTNQISFVPCFLDGFLILSRKENVSHPLKEYPVPNISLVYGLCLSYKSLPKNTHPVFVKRDSGIEDYRLN
jgi:hypothetical protein